MEATVKIIDVKVAPLSFRATTNGSGSPLGHGLICKGAALLCFNALI